jgi:bifunctional non-homologous end joining protein LigD
VVVEGPGVVLTPAWPAGEGQALFAATAEQGLEVVVAKRLGSPYRAGVRSSDWVKCKHWTVEEFAVGGWLPDPGGGLKAIVLGRRVPDGLAYAGSVEYGFDREDLGAKLRALPATNHGVTGAPPGTRPVRPGLTVRVRYQSLTDKGRVRAAAVTGFGPDE